MIFKQIFRNLSTITDTLTLNFKVGFSASEGSYPQLFTKLSTICVVIHSFAAFRSRKCYVPRRKIFPLSRKVKNGFTFGEIYSKI